MDTGTFIDIYFKYRRDHLDAAALEVVEAALAKNPADHWWLHERGDMLRRLKRFAEAEETLRPLVSSQSEHIRRLEVTLGHLFADMGRYEEAEAWLRKATVADAGSTIPWVYLGHFLIHRGKPAEAIRELEHGLQAEGDRDEVLLKMAISHKILGNLDEAKQLIERALEITPSYEAAKWELSDLESAMEIKRRLGDPGGHS